MGLGAILVVGEERQAFCSTSPQAGNYLLGEPIECVEILGRSMLERTIERFARTDIEVITVLAPSGYSVPVLSGMYSNVNVWAVGDVASAITQLLQDYSQQGIEHSFRRCRERVRGTRSSRPFLLPSGSSTNGHAGLGSRRPFRPLGCRLCEGATSRY